MMPHIIKPGSKVDLFHFDTKVDRGLPKEEAEARQLELGKKLGRLQELMFAAGTHSLLIVLQGRDTSGKDGTIRCLYQCMNAQATRVAPFKVPTPNELAHDFLWRVHAQTPGRGETVIFNRSHYEDILVVRVHNLVPEAVWKTRFDHINAFEKLLVSSKTILVKFCLAISKEEQEERLLAREADDEKAWKLSVGDWKEREYWDAYTEAYEDVLTKCSTENAPWHLIPADHKWYRNLAVTEALLGALKPYEQEWTDHLSALGEKMKAEISAWKSEQNSKR